MLWIAVTETVLIFPQNVLYFRFRYDREAEYYKPRPYWSKSYACVAVNALYVSFPGEWEDVSFIFSMLILLMYFPLLKSFCVVVSFYFALKLLFLPRTLSTVCYPHRNCLPSTNFWFYWFGFCILVVLFWHDLVLSGIY